MRSGDAGQRAAIRRAIEQGGRSELDAVVRAVNETGALEYARRAAQAESQAAADAIAHLGDSVYRDTLLQLTVFAVERRF
jgi:octaprenyl-diphosphate synthase